MEQFISQLGIDWRLLLSQAVNFLLVLIVLRIFVYGPVLKVLKERREKIEEGLAKAEEAGQRLLEAELVKKNKIGEAEEEILVLRRENEARLQTAETAHQKGLEEQTAAMMKTAEAKLKNKKEEFQKEIKAEAVHLIKQALVSAAHLRPQEIDEALIKEVLKQTPTRS